MSNYYPVTIPTNTPTYLSTLLNDTEEIFLVYSVQSNDLDTSSAKSPPTFVDVTGSPLKVDLDSSELCTSLCQNTCSPWTKDEEKQYPVSIEFAQKYIREYCAENRMKPNVKPVWCICSHRNEDKIVLLSMQHTPQFIKHSTVILEGYLPEDHPDLDLDNVCRKHLDDIEYDIVRDNFIRAKPKRSLREIESNVMAIYEISGTKMSYENFDDSMNSKGSVILELMWNRCSKTPIEDAKTKMLIQTVVGNNTSAAFNIWKDLILLELYMSALSEYDLEIMADTDWIPSSGGNISIDRDLTEWTLEIVNNFRTYQRYSDEVEGKSLQSVIESVRTEPSKDITGELWTVFKHCTTYGALRECINVFFTEIAYTECMIRIPEHNKTCLAEIVRGIVAGKLAVPTCSGIQPIELLIEIGLEKLKQDFLMIFFCCEIVDKYEISKLFSNNISEVIQDNITYLTKHRSKLLLQEKTPIINLENALETMKILGQLQVILEMLLLVPMDCVQHVSKSVYNTFVGPESPVVSFKILAHSKFHEAHVDVLYSHISHYISRISPASWRLSLSTKLPTHSSQTILYLSQRPIFPPSIYSPDINDKTTEEQKSKTYYYCTKLLQGVIYLTSNQ